MCLPARNSRPSDLMTDFAKAQAKAKAEKKLVLIDFTGSDWCPPCMALHKNVLTSKEFTAFRSDDRFCQGAGESKGGEKTGADRFHRFRLVSAVHGSA